MTLQFPVASGKKKKAQVFECPAETWKERKPRHVKTGATNDEPELTAREQIRKDFDESLKFVVKLSKSCSMCYDEAGVKEKKAHENKRIEELGGKEVANRKMPYKMLISINTKGAARKRRREELMKEAGVVTGKRKSSGKVNGQQKRKKADYGLQATKGKFKGDVLDVRGPR